MQKITRRVIAATALFAVTLHCPAQTNIVTAIRSTTDGAKVISWNAVPGAFYTIESAESLAPTTLAIPQWVSREVAFPSQGTNAAWMDVGDASWIPRIYHPKVSVQRFYRVTQTGTTSLPPPTVTFSLCTNGVALSAGQSARGFLEVRYTVDPGTNGDMISQILTLVDGQIIKRGAPDSTNAWVNTTEWDNAQHTIWVEAKTTDSTDTTPDTQDLNDAGETKEGVGISSVRTLNFTNYIYDFFVATPFFTPSVDGPQEIVANFQEDSYWRLYVLQGGQTVVNAFEGTNISMYAAWDGTDFNGSPLYDGYYDYLIEARPTRIGPFQDPLLASAVGSRIQPSPTTMVGGGIQPSATSMAQQQEWSALAGIPPVIQFQRDDTLQLPPSDRNPLSLGPSAPGEGGGGDPPSPMTLSGTSAANPAIDLVAMPLDGSGDPVPFILYPPGYDTNTLLIFDARLLATLENLPGQRARASRGPVPNGPQPQDDDVTDTQTTSTPIREPGQRFKGFAGVFATAYQSHHVSWQDVGFFSMPSGAHGFTSTWAPFGKLKTAGMLCDNFSSRMTSSGWRRAFQLADEQFRWPDLTGCFTGDCVSQYGISTAFGGRFRGECNFGLLAGHMVAADSTPEGASHSYYPFWNPTYASSLGGTLRSYDWITLPQMDFGQSDAPLGGPSPLMWMCLYGCNSARAQDVNDMWTKFLLPFPPNLRLLLGSASRVQIAPVFGTTFGDDLNGLSAASQGSPMSIVDSWYDAARAACLQARASRDPRKWPSACTMSVVYRDETIWGDPTTYGDSIWSFQQDPSQDWTDIGWETRGVYP